MQKLPGGTHSHIMTMSQLPVLSEISIRQL
jgi:hypothetical protein